MIKLVSSNIDRIIGTTTEDNLKFNITIYCIICFETNFTFIFLKSVQISKIKTEGLNYYNCVILKRCKNNNNNKIMNIYLYSVENGDIIIFILLHNTINLYYSILITEFC